MKSKTAYQLAKHGVEASMSSTGNCYDNAVAESFFGLLKRERVDRVRYRTRGSNQADIACPKDSDIDGVDSLEI